MNLNLATSFLKSLDKLPNQHKKAAQQSVFLFQVDLNHPALNFEKLKGTKDPGMHSIRCNEDVRAIVHKHQDTYSVCYVDHHKEAYSWAAKHIFQANQDGNIVKVVEVIEEIVQEQIIKPKFLFDDITDAQLMEIGVPKDKISNVRALKLAADMLYLLEDLKDNVWDALDDLLHGPNIATLEPDEGEQTNEGQIAESTEPRESGIQLLQVDSEEELQKALDFPLEQWVVFLHPTQREVVEREFSGPSRVFGPAGTGKTVVALHRAAYLARKYPADKILLTTYSRALAARLSIQADILMGTDSVDRKRLVIENLHSVATRLLVDNGTKFQLFSRPEVTALLKKSIKEAKDSDVPLAFLESEWDAVIDPWGIKDWDSYRKLPRRGRATPLGARRRRQIWEIYERVLTESSKMGHRSFSQLCRDAAEIMSARDTSEYDHVIVDESQDFGPTELSLLRALVKEGPDDLMLCGDNGQRIYKPRASWRSLGVQVVGRSYRLKINYRTSEDIRKFADSILPGTIANDDGEAENRNSVSLFRGPIPTLKGSKSDEDQSHSVVAWVEDLLAKGYKPGDIAVFGRTKNDSIRIASQPLKKSGIATKEIDENQEPDPNRVSLGTMHVAKGLEFPAVALVACNSQRLPLARALKGVDDPADRDEVIEKERHLLYVAATRARENLLVTYTGSPSSFLPKH